MKSPGGGKPTNGNRNNEIYCIIIRNVLKDTPIKNLTFLKSRKPTFKANKESERKSKEKSKEIRIIRREGKRRK